MQAPYDGHVFLAYKYTRKIRLPGVTVHFLATPASLASDYPFLGNLGVSSLARAMLENLEPDKTQGDVAKCQDAEALESRLEAEFAAMNRLRDFSRRLACDSFDVVRNQLEKSNAFSDDDGVILRF